MDNPGNTGMVFKTIEVPDDSRPPETADPSIMTDNR